MFRSVFFFFFVWLSFLFVLFVTGFLFFYDRTVKKLHYLMEILTYLFLLFLVCTFIFRTKYFYVRHFVDGYILDKVFLYVVCDCEYCICFRFNWIWLTYETWFWYFYLPVDICARTKKCAKINSDFFFENLFIYFFAALVDLCIFLYFVAVYAYLRKEKNINFTNFINGIILYYLAPSAIAKVANALILATVSWWHSSIQ